MRTVLSLLFAVNGVFVSVYVLERSIWEHLMASVVVVEAYSKRVRHIYLPTIRCIDSLQRESASV